MKKDAPSARPCLSDSFKSSSRSTVRFHSGQVSEALPVVEAEEPEVEGPEVEVSVLAEVAHSAVVHVRLAARAVEEVSMAGEAAVAEAPVSVEALEAEELARVAFAEVAHLAVDRDPSAATAVVEERFVQTEAASDFAAHDKFAVAHFLLAAESRWAVVAEELFAPVSKAEGSVQVWVVEPVFVPAFHNYSAARLRSEASRRAVDWELRRASAPAASEAEAVPAPAFAGRYSAAPCRLAEELSRGPVSRRVAVGFLCRAGFPEPAFRVLRPGRGVV
jgi:hypothetical protein